jgi:protein-S-isoprenylcysteine O-methyltransferase Ste14
VDGLQKRREPDQLRLDDSSTATPLMATMRQRHFIDSHKLATGPFVLGLMAWLNAWDNPAAWLYLALHGTYGILWVTKSRVFPDRSWEERTGIAYGLFIWAGLTLYWVAPFLLMYLDVRVHPAWAAACVALYAVGIFLHFASDMQKYTALQARPGHLITDGLFARIRNPNYLGELMIYLGFGLLAMHWAPLAVIATFILVVWLPNMWKKDRSLSRYPEFAEYRSRSWLFLPPLY